jgi:hypothetical protein
LIISRKKSASPVAARRRVEADSIHESGVAALTNWKAGR